MLSLKQPYFYISAILLLVFSFTSLRAQSGFTSSGGANFIGFGRAGTNLTGIAAMYNNQAGLTDIQGFAADLSIERRFNLDELTLTSLAVAKSFSFGTIGLMASHFGFEEYSEQKFGLAYARKLTEKFSLGGQFDMLRININQYGSSNYLTFEIGVNYVINNEFRVATHIFSPGGIALAENSVLGSRFRMGVKYQPSAKVFLLLEGDKLIDRAVTEFKMGLSYQMAKQIELRLGANLSASAFSFGVAVNLANKYKIATAYSLQNILGNTPALSLQYQND
ncbi:MAG: hypothetical protein IPM42_00355 [Saprospiraceae bacterium]|nr:hypothetical protein [Saprospiraceae bacterium]